MTSTAKIRIGTAGWSITRAVAPRFASPGSHLQRYARRFRCVEINSTFYRPHLISTFARWRDSTPPDFRFAVKVPREISHELKLKRARRPLIAFLAQTEGLAEKRGPILLQLPPSFAFDKAVVTRFLALVRGLYDGLLVCEPRHSTWFTPEVDSLLAHHRVARVAADPAPAPGAFTPGGSPGVVYYRLHGSPRKYWSRYDKRFLAKLASTLRKTTSAEEVWCVFDNTASGAAIENAQELWAGLSPK